MRRGTLLPAAPSPGTVAGTAEQPAAFSRASTAMILKRRFGSFGRRLAASAHGHLFSPRPEHNWDVGKVATHQTLANLRKAAVPPAA